MTDNRTPEYGDGWERGQEFAFYHCLVDDDPDQAAPALEALGRTAATWSRMEHHIDALIVQINKPDFSEHLFEPQHPVSFSRKLDLLKRWFNQYPPLSEYTEDIRFLISRLRTLSKESGERLLTRNVLLHSIPAQYDSENQVLTLHHMKFVGTDIHSRHIEVDLNQLENFTQSVKLANDLLGMITKELFTVDGYEKLQRRG
jgi:hypothetical protein